MEIVERCLLTFVGLDLQYRLGEFGRRWSLTWYYELVGGGSEVESKKGEKIWERR